MLGLGGDQVLWPVNRRTGALIPPLYFHIDLVRGRAWYSSRYVSTRRRRGFGRWNRSWSGWGRGRMNAAPSITEVRNG
jgi:hypothetical protein